MDIDDLVTRFSIHKPSNEHIAELHSTVRVTLFEAVDLLDSKIPDCQEKTTAVRKMEEAMFWFNAAVARRMNGPERAAPKTEDGFAPYGHHRLEHSDEVLESVHDSTVCVGQACAIHRMTDHSMRSFPQHWRSDRKMVERICTHGVGHPDPDERPDLDTVHGCDGCCAMTEHQRQQAALKNVLCDGCGWYVNPRSRHACFSGA